MKGPDEYSGSTDFESFAERWARSDAAKLVHRVSDTLDASDEGILIFDARTVRYLHANGGVVRLIGYDVAELAGGMAPWHLERY